MSTISLGFNDIGIAWRFVEECADEDPRTYGVDAVTTRAVPGRDGVYRTRPAVVDLASLAAREAWDDACDACDVCRDDDEDVEDALIARLDGERDDDIDVTPWIADEAPANDARIERTMARVMVCHRRVRRAHEPLRAV